MLNRLAFTNLMQARCRYCGVKTRVKRKLLPNHTYVGSYHERRIIKAREYSVNHPWQLLPRENVPIFWVERYPQIPRFLEGEDETKGVPWFGAIA